MNNFFNNPKNRTELVRQENYMGLQLEVHRIKHMPGIGIRCNGYVGGEIVRELVNMGFDPYDEQLQGCNEITYKNYQVLRKNGETILDYKWVDEPVEVYVIGFDHFHFWDNDNPNSSDPDYVLEECKQIAMQLHQTLSQLKRGF